MLATPRSREGLAGPVALFPRISRPVLPVGCELEIHVWKKISVARPRVAGDEVDRGVEQNAEVLAEAGDRVEVLVAGNLHVRDCPVVLDRDVLAFGVDAVLPLRVDPEVLHGDAIGHDVDSARDLETAAVKDRVRGRDRQLRRAVRRRDHAGASGRCCAPTRRTPSVWVSTASLPSSPRLPGYGYSCHVVLHCAASTSATACLISASSRPAALSWATCAASAAIACCASAVRFSPAMRTCWRLTVAPKPLRTP